MQDDEDDLGTLEAYGDIIQDVLAGRTEGHKCPICGEGVLDCRADEAIVRLECPRCGRYFEGMLA